MLFRSSSLFHDLLKKQLVLKNIVTLEDWEAELDTKIFYDWKRDSHFLEFNDTEIVTRRIELASAAIALGEDYYSVDYIKKNMLKLSDEEVDNIEIDNETEKGEEGEEAPSPEETSPSPETETEPTPPEEG